MTFKIILVVMLILFFFYVLLLPRQVIFRKIAVLGLIVLMLVFAVEPQWSTAVAQAVGIGRGADLLFYISHVVLFFVAVTFYVKIKELENRFARLVRHIALTEGKAKPPGSEPRGGPPSPGAAP